VVVGYLEKIHEVVAVVLGVLLALVMLLLVLVLLVLVLLVHYEGVVEPQLEIGVVVRCFVVLVCVNMHPNRKVDCATIVVP
jgi:hypothetical protein